MAWGRNKKTEQVEGVLIIFGTFSHTRTSWPSLSPWQFLTVPCAPPCTQWRRLSSSALLKAEISSFQVQVAGTLQHTSDYVAQNEMNGWKAREPEEVTHKQHQSGPGGQISATLHPCLAKVNVFIRTKFRCVAPLFAWGSTWKGGSYWGMLE